MAWPGYPDSFDPGWYRVQIVTPPIFPGTGTLANGSAAVTAFSASYQAQVVTPLPGQQVSGNGVPALTYILPTPAPTVNTFTMSAAATTNGAKSLTVGAEPVSLAEAVQWARVEFTDDNTLIQDIIAGAREELEGPGLKRAIMLQSRCMYFMGFPWSGGYYNRLIRSMGPNPWWLPTAQGIIMLAYPPLQEVTSIKYIDPSSGNLLDIASSQFIFSRNSTPGRVQPQYGVVWPLSRPVIDSVQITYTCGYGAFTSDVPYALKLSLRQMVAAAYENREAFQEGQMEGIGPWVKFRDTEWWGSYQ